MIHTFHRRFATASIALVAVLALSRSRAAQNADDKVTLRFRFAPGDRWAFDEDMILKLKFNVLANGNVAQALDQTTHKVRKGDFLVLEAKGERLESVRARFGPECLDTEQADAATPQKKPTALAGQTVTVRRQAQGDAEVACAVTLSDEEQKEARELIDPTDGFFAKKAVKVGDRWISDEKAIARMFELGPEDRGTLRMTLKALRDVGGRRTAEISAALVLQQKQDYMKIATDLEGTILIDVETGVAVDIELRGPLAISGETQQDDESGNSVKVTVEGGGECTYRGVSRRLTGESGSVTASTPEPAPSRTEPAQESAERFGHMIFTTPPGWNAMKYANGMTLQPTDLRDGAHLQVTLLQSIELSGSLDQALERSWNEACAQFGCTTTHSGSGIPYSKQQSGASFKGWEYVRGDGYARSPGGDFYMNLFVVKVNNRFERIAALSKKTSQRDAGYYQDPRYYDVIQELLFSIRFDDWKEPPPLPRATLKGDGIVGVWNGISMMGGKLKACYAIFFSNGQAFFGSRYLMNGFDGLNTRVDAEMTPRYWGTYTFANGTGILKMGYGEIPLRWNPERVDGSGLILTTTKTDHKFVRLPASVDGAKLDGTWILKGQYSDGRPDPFITFTPSGEFKDQGAVNVLNHGYPLEEPPGAGTYEVKNFTLTLRFSDGRRYRLAFPGKEWERGNVRPARLILSYNEDALVRR